VAGDGWIQCGTSRWSWKSNNKEKKGGDDKSESKEKKPLVFQHERGGNGEDRNPFFSGSEKTGASPVGVQKEAKIGGGGKGNCPPSACFIPSGGISRVIATDRMLTQCKGGGGKVVQRATKSSGTCHEKEGRERAPKSARSSESHRRPRW